LVRKTKRRNVANSRVIEYPEKALEINVECILENKRLAIRGAFCEFPWGRWVG